MVARTQVVLQANIHHLDRLSLLAEGLVEVLAARLAVPNGEAAPGVKLDATVQSCRAGGLEVSARIQEHGGLIDLNAADPALLAAGFAALGMGEEADALAQTVEFYRAPGAASSAAAAIAGGPKAAPFESVAELSDLAPLRKLPLARLMEVFTVHSHSGVVGLA